MKFVAVVNVPFVPAQLADQRDSDRIGAAQHSRYATRHAFSVMARWTDLIEGHLRGADTG